MKTESIKINHINQLQVENLHSNALGAGNWRFKSSRPDQMNYPAAELRSIKRNFRLTPMQSIEEFF